MLSGWPYLIACIAVTPISLIVGFRAARYSGWEPMGWLVSFFVLLFLVGVLGLGELCPDGHCAIDADYGRYGD